VAGAPQTLVWGAWFFLLPMLLLGLAVLAWRHDRTAALVLGAAGIGVLTQTLAVLTGRLGVMLSPPAIVVVGVLSLVAFGVRLWRDRSRGHVRSTAESLAVLAIGAVFSVGPRR
jgi:bacteriorhodopsin